MLRDMVWESTDNFGNLMSATSNATTLEDLRVDVKSLLEELFHRQAGKCTISVDVPFSQIAGPDENRVSHVLTVPGLSKISDPQPEAVPKMVREVAADLGNNTVEVVGPWD